MIELWVILTLAALGYMINKSASQVKSTFQLQSDNNSTLNKGEIPSYTNIYSSTNFKKTQQQERRRAAKMHCQSQNPSKTNVIPKVKSLTGEYMDPNDFRHNNMTPFFGSAIKQNMNDDKNATLIENYTGSSDLQKSKCETTSFFDVSRNVGNVYGSQNVNDTLLDRYVPSRMRNNEKPIDEIHVGPGIGQGYTSTPTGGYQQFEIQECTKPKTVDELRTVNNPKTTYNGRVVDGLKTELPLGKDGVGTVEKNRADTYYQQGTDRWFVTTGAYTKQSDIPDFDIKDTSRQETSHEYIGNALRTQGKEGVLEGQEYSAPFKEQFGEFGYRNPLMINEKAGYKDDFGKSTILVYDNERQITGVRVYQGNMTSMVKSLVAPIIDAVKTTKKDGFTDNPRHFGNAAPQIPDKLTTYDPNDVARTTIKETLLHDDTYAGTVKGPVQVAVYDPDEVIAKKTIRETLRNMQYEMNLRGGANKGTVYDPDDKTKTTMKETLIDNERQGNPDTIEGGGAYETTEYSAKNTTKQTLSLYDHYGAATYNSGVGYLTNKTTAPNTQKQYTSDNDYYGAAASFDKKEMSKVNYTNARIRPNQESLLHQREPTKEGVKGYTTGDDINMQIRKDTLQTCVDKPNLDRVLQQPQGYNEAVHVTRGPKEVEHIDTRLDPSILNSLSKNPYAISIA